jgi:IS30 family transposase
MKRQYTHVQELGTEALALAESGYSYHAIANQLGLQDQAIVKELLKRHRRNLRAVEAGIAPKQRGRKPAVTLAEYKYENKRLKMENNLLRDFLQLAGRR